jgi:hypothetical protein
MAIRRLAPSSGKESEHVKPGCLLQKQAVPVTEDGVSQSPGLDERAGKAYAA